MRRALQGLFRAAGRASFRTGRVRKFYPAPPGGKASSVTKMCFCPVLDCCSLPRSSLRRPNGCWLHCWPSSLHLQVSRHVSEAVLQRHIERAIVMNGKGLKAKLRCLALSMVGGVGRPRMMNRCFLQASVQETSWVLPALPAKLRSLILGSP